MPDTDYYLRARTDNQKARDAEREPAAVFEPDWEAIGNELAIHSSDHFSWSELAMFALVEYQAQRRTAGIVDVWREDLSEILASIPSGTPATEQSWQRLSTALDAAIGE